jgi:FkbM family methyltransferase
VPSKVSVPTRLTTRAITLLLRYAWGRRFSFQIFKAIVEQAPGTLSHELVEEFVDRRAELAAAQLVKSRPELVEQQLVVSVPTFGLRQECYAQEGEDLVLARMFHAKQDGFYVDVGAHHPIRFSNTYLLYRLGWQGINIDATPNSMDEFRQVRPRDINIECLVSSSETSQSFYVLNEPALNTSSLELARQRSHEDPRYQIAQTVVLKPRTLASILDEHLTPGRKIDLFNVDVEGLDLEVLQSNDWGRYRPTIILAELLPENAADHDQHAIKQYLSSKGYKMTSRFFNTALFQVIE